MRVKDPIKSANLRTQEEKALERLGVTTIGRFLELDISLFFPRSSQIHRSLTIAKERISRQIQGERRSENSLRTDEDQSFPSSEFASLEDVWEFLSERARRVLKVLKIRNILAFLEISKPDVVRIKGVGIRTWREISIIQKRLSGDTLQAPEDFDQLNLGTKEKKALQLLKVNTVKELMAFDLLRASVIGHKNETFVFQNYFIFYRPT